MDAELVRSRTEAALAGHAPEFGSFFLARFLDLRISYDDPSRTCRVDLPYADFTVNPQGSVHGGVVTTVMDISMGHLCHRYLSTGVTLEMKTTFIRRVAGYCWARGRLLNAGRRIVQLESHMYREDGELAAHATSTWQRLSNGTSGAGNAKPRR